MSRKSVPDFPVEIGEHNIQHRAPDGRLQFDISEDLGVMAHLVSDIYMQLRRANRKKLAHHFGLTYLAILEELNNDHCHDDSSH